LKALQSEMSRLRSAHSSLQEKIDSSTSQLSKLSDELSNARGLTQGYQKELANLQRTLNLKVDANRDLSTQIADLSQAMRKLQKDAEAYISQIGTLRTSLENQEAANARLASENEDLKNTIRQMQSTISALTSKEDSLARQFIDLKAAKEKLDDFALSVNNLNTRITEERTEGGFYYGKTSIYLKSVLLGYLEWRLPAHLSRSEEKNAEASFSTESIDYVRVSADERRLLRSLGNKLKVQVILASPVTAMEVKRQEKEGLQEVGERDRATWHWKILNRGTQDGRLLLDVHMVDRNSKKIPLLHEDHLLVSSNVVRQLRSYLQPIPMIAGILIGFLLFGIAGIFRRARSNEIGGRRHAAGPSDPPPHIGQKQL